MADRSDPEGRQRRERHELEHPDWPRRLTAEVFGTFALVFVAAGADVAARLSGDEVSAAARAVAPALMVAALIYSIGDRSGAHFNPVVTLAFGLKRLVPAAWVPAYWLAQAIGAVGAALLLRLLFGAAIDAGVTRPKLVDASTAVVIEAVLTLLLVTVILGTADRFRVVGPNAALAVGATIALCGLVALPIEGASMNPARSLGPAVVAGDLGDLWVYVLGPAIGAAGAVVLTVFLHGTMVRDGAEEAARGED
ncbi:MAG TPA: aquaporin [Candidatus Limnocylindrales bacterium]